MKQLKSSPQSENPPSPDKVQPLLKPVGEPVTYL